MMSAVSFRAKFINNENVQRLNSLKKRYDKASAAFVEINPNNPKDCEAVKNAVSSWSGDLYGKSIYHTLELQSKDDLESNKSKIYALTFQTDCYENLQSKKILALAEIAVGNKSFNLLRYIQTNPDYIRHFVRIEPQKYKGVGTAMLNSLKKVYSTIFLNASSTGLDYFYRQNGFKLVSKTGRTYFWSHKI